MQLRTGSGNGDMALRRVGGGPPIVGTPQMRGGFAVDYGQRVDDRRQALLSPASRPAYNSKEDHDETAPSRHLWVGNVSQDVSEAMITDRFTQFGEVDSVTVYSSRNYAFVNFRNQADAVEAKNRLQGFVLGGMAIRIEYAKGRMMKSEPARERGADFHYTENMEEQVEARAKQSRHLWVGGISPNVSKEQIEGEFKKIGLLEDFKLLRDRNCAFVDFVRIEDAVGAVDALNRKRFGDEELRVDYGRSQPLKRDIRGDERGSNARDHQGLQDGYHGPQHGYQGGGGNVGDGRGKADKDGGPSEVLWVGFPLPSKVDEDGLRRAFMPYGEVERVKTFPGRTYAFVQFQTVEDATRAKNALDGKLFDDPRVHIRYSKSEIGPIDSPRDAPLPSAQRIADRQGYIPDMLGVPRGTPSAGNDRFGSPGRASPNPNARLGGGLRPEYRPNALMAGLTIERGNSRNPELGPGMGRVSGRSASRLEEMDYPRGNRPDSRSSFDDGWDLPDADIIPRDSKRMRVYPGGGADSPSFDPRYDQRQHRGSEGGNYIGTAGLNNFEAARLPSTPDYNQGLGGRPRGGLPIADPLSVGTRPTIIGHASAPGSVSATSVYGKRDMETVKGPEGWQWHGTIAKGGTPVCRARCLPVGKGIDATVPDVVNCTARTDLDMLAKHVYQAGDFGVVFFVPEGDPDVPPYQDFMHYLGEKHRAGVAKLADGTTLFLVPPSEFSEKVLKVPGQNCLFGVVLKFQQPVPTPQANYNPSSQQQQPPPLSQNPFPQQQQPSSQHPPAPQLQYLQPQAPPQHGPPLQDTSVFQGSHQPLTSHAQQPQTGVSSSSMGSNDAPPNSNSSPMLTQAQLASIAGLPGVLTPELIASLTALLPKTSTSQAPSSTEMNLGSTSVSNGVKGFNGNAGIPVGSSPMQGAPPPSAGNPLQNEMRPMFRPPQNNPPSGPPQGWPSPQQQSPQDRPQVGMGGYHSQATDPGPIYTSQPAQQQQQQQLLPQQQPQIHQHPLPQQPLQQQTPQLQMQPNHASGLPPSGLAVPLTGQGPSFPGPQLQQGYPGPSGSGVQQFPPLPQMPRPPQQPMGGPPQLPSDQLAQLTALLTQRHQQPAQQQAAAQLLQQHYQQNSSTHPNSQASGGPQQPQQGSVHQSQPPPQQQQQQHQPALGLAQQPQPPSFGQYPHSSWGQSPSTHLQPQPVSQGSSQPMLLTAQQQQQQQVPSQMQAVSWENPATQTTVGADPQGGFQNQGVSESDAQNKRFQATVQLAAALLQQMQQQQGKPSGGQEQR